MAFLRKPDYTTPAIEEGVKTRDFIGQEFPVYNSSGNTIPFRFVKYDPNTNVNVSGGNPGVIPITADEPNEIAGVLLRPSGHGNGVYKTINSQQVSWVTDTGFSGLPSNYPSSVLSKGFVNVYFEQDLTFDDDIYMRFTSGAGGTELGRLRADSDTGTCLLVPKGKITLTKPALANSFSEIRLDF